MRSSALQLGYSQSEDAEIGQALRGRTKIIEDLEQIIGAHRCGRRQAVATAKLMPGPTSRELEQRAEEARVVAEQMHNPGTKRTMINLALSYERLAKHAALREATETAEQNAPPEQGRNEAA